MSKAASRKQIPESGKAASRKQTPDVRNLALNMLKEVLEEDIFLHIALNRVLSANPDLPARERGFLERVVRGTVQRRITIDYVLEQFSKTPLRKMKPLIRTILRMGIYEILFMDQVPDRAACSEAVRLAKRRGLSGLSGFVNGILRNVVREKEAAQTGVDLSGNAKEEVWADDNLFLIVPEPAEEAETLSVRYSMPRWLVDRFLPEYGSQGCIRLLEAFLAERPVTIRPNPEKTNADELERLLKKEGAVCKRLSDPPYAMELTSFGSLARLKAFRGGLFYVQDAASMQVAEWAAPEEGACVLDVCAAPGGKSIHIAQKLHGTGSVTARDLSPDKVALIRENIRRQGISNMRTEVWDARKPDPAFLGKADIVVADLPCSGLGVAGRKADIRYRVTEEDIKALAALQREILSVVCSYVKPGGMLLYSTCTITPEENMENAAWFSETHPEFCHVAQKQYMPWDGTDGFFIVKWRRDGEGTKAAGSDSPDGAGA